MNNLVFQRTKSFKFLDPSWVDGCKNCPGPIDNILFQRYLGLMVRDLTHGLFSKGLSQVGFKIGRELTILNATNKEKSGAVKVYMDEPWPCGEDRLRSILDILNRMGIVIPYKDPNDSPYARGFTTGPLIRDLIIGERLETIAELMVDPDLKNQTLALAGSVFQTHVGRKSL